MCIRDRSQDFAIPLGKTGKVYFVYTFANESYYSTAAESWKAGIVAVSYTHLIFHKGVAGVPTEDRMRVLRLIENMTMGTAAVGYLPESMHGAGSPQAQRIMIARQSNLEMKKELAKKIARIK